LLKPFFLKVFKHPCLLSRPENRKTGRPFGLQNSKNNPYFDFVISSPGGIEKHSVNPGIYKKLPIYPDRQLALLTSQ
jgi:hypothetical protein